MDEIKHDWTILSRDGYRKFSGVLDKAGNDSMKDKRILYAMLYCCITGDTKEVIIEDLRPEKLEAKDG